MGKLLAWGKALFYVRYVQGKLLVERMDINREKNNVSLCPCSIRCDKEASVLPSTAHLVAANVVEDSAFAIQYPLLVFTSSQQTDLMTQSSLPTTKLQETSSSNDDSRLKSSPCLYFFTLSNDKSDDKFRFQFLNILEVPLPMRDEEVAASEKAPDTLQVLLMDGPNVLVFERRVQRLMLLTFQREGPRNESMRFTIRHQELDMIHDMNSDHGALFDLVSSVYVSERHCSKPHLLIHTLSLNSLDSCSSNGHNWSIVDLDCHGEKKTSKKQASMCNYLPVLSCDGAHEQITCYCHITKLNDWDFTLSSFSERNAFAWGHESKAQLTKTKVHVQTLVITGSTSNSINVHNNGILLVSYLLPCQPVEILPLNEDNVDQRHLLCVRCEDADRSVFMLGFSSNVQNMSMELVSTFKHVGVVQVGKFACMDVLDGFSSTQILLLNEVQALCGTSPKRHNDSSGNEEQTDETMDPRQLLKRSVLVLKKTNIPEIKLTYHRLRFRENKKSKFGSRSRKRRHNNGDMILADPKSEVFRYIELTQKASARGKTISGFEAPGDETTYGAVASNAQLEKLACSLSTRLRNGLHELERLQVHVSGKESLVYQLNQLIFRLWQKTLSRTQDPSTESPTVTPLYSIRNDATPYYGSLGHPGMETIVSATRVPWSSMKDVSRKQVSELGFCDVVLEKQVVLEQFNVLEYVSSSSLLYAEVALKNMSELVLYDCFVVLTARNGCNVCTHGRRDLYSVATDVSSSLCNAEQQREVRFRVAVKFEPSFSFLRDRKPFEMMLWLHWTGSKDNVISTTTPSWYSSASSAFPVASVQIYPEDLLGKVETNMTNRFSPNRSFGEGFEQSQLLLLSSGSNLRSWLDKLTIEVPTAVIDFAIRPTFALLTIRGKTSEGMLQVSSRIVRDLPRDVYAMENPFRRNHFRMLQLVVRSMRQEMIITRRNGLADDRRGKNHSGEARHKAEDEDSTASRAMERNTDLQVNLLLQRLQKRVNFHSMWFDGCTKSPSIYV
ncbi:hypothetical protein PsorP6_011765 [Peronosclerospora sorghi]|uniref:Uncharacterized protein n=1 Tax=Peronosclerospora sorghi TaxID=230839 RepID=A0ACC0WK65_9STRA|nr:hypothetical protein PsorP6_011765 [Peronosclerospora sorghi]